MNAFYSHQYHFNLLNFIYIKQFNYNKINGLKNNCIIFFFNFVLTSDFYNYSNKLNSCVFNFMYFEILKSVMNVTNLIFFISL